MRHARSGDLAGGLLTTAFGAAVLVHVRSFPELPGGQPGPALFPGIIGALMVVFGVALGAQSLRRSRTDGAGSCGPGSKQATGDDMAGGDAPTPLSRRRASGNALAMLGAIAVYILVADLLGFALTMLLLLAALMLQLGTRPVVAVGAAVVTTLAMSLIFRQLLLVPLPTGPFGV